jgi:two-component system chemotaxis response regulator CheY
MKVLVVDDDVIQRMLLVDLLGRYEGVEVVEAANGALAWQEVQNGLCPVLCCCDMLMPEMSGIEFLQHFKSLARLADVPFVFITASTDSDTVKKAIALGAADYILKPVNFIKARSCLDRVFRNIYTQYSEDPSATQKRLRISPERLIGYYLALQQQLAQIWPSDEKQSAGGDTPPALNLLDGVKSACVTVGLWHAAKMIEWLPELGADGIHRISKDLEAIVAKQVLAARNKFGIREAPKPAQAKVPT